MLKLFFKYLIAGPDARHWNGERKQVRIQAVCEDVIFSAIDGKIKPKKHLMLGITLKSLTGSRKIMEIMNRLGHSSSYHTIEEIETEMTFQATKNKRLTPFGMSLAPEFGTGVTWDNFDRFVNTTTGKDTLHDTVGIAYQVVPSVEQCEDVQFESLDQSSEISTTSKKRQRAFEPTGLNIQPYRKKLKLVSTSFLPNDDEKRLAYEELSSALQNRWKIDILWMANFLVDTATALTPLWAGWNTPISLPADYTHNIWYLSQINQSPTNHSVVAETLRRSLDITAEAGKTNISVTYDLAIAKIAMQIQEEERPQFDKIFIALRPFHVELAFFSALGKIVAGSGGPYILQESEALAKGSINGFLSGKNYKRCKRMHEILSLSMEILHFKSFL